MKYACLYYGYPSSFSGTWDIDDCAHLFAEYDIVVWGDLYQMPEHEDYVNAKQIASKMLKQHKELEFFGYVPIGLHPSQKESNLSIEEIKKRIQYWRIVGVTGIFLDEFGFDYYVSRERQNEIVEYCHNHNLTVIANAWKCEYIFSKQDIYLDWIDFHGNPNHLDSALTEHDYILFENAWHAVQDGQTQTASYKEEWNEQNRMWDVYAYYYTPQSDLGGKSYYQQFKTKTFAFDGIVSTENKKQREQYYRRGLLASIRFNIDAYAASTENWGADGIYQHYKNLFVKLGRKN